jgi:high-affinity Fe2+/Pb2+ permease
LQEQLTAILLIQQALTPVFLIVGMGTFLNSLTSRLARIVDRVRWFDLPDAVNCCQQKRQQELKALARRMRWANWAINLLCGAAVVVCINIFLIVIQGYFATILTSWIVGSFVSTLALLALGLICFFIEVSIATTSLRVSEPLIRGDQT